MVHYRFASTLLSRRNLSKPIAVQSKEKEDRYVNNYRVRPVGACCTCREGRAHRDVFVLFEQYLEEEYKKGIREDDPMPPVQPYHYGSHYSNSGTVLHFLVRMPPFTKMFLAYQGESETAWFCSLTPCPSGAFSQQRIVTRLFHSAGVMLRLWVLNCCNILILDVTKQHVAVLHHMCIIHERLLHLSTCLCRLLAPLPPFSALSFLALSFILSLSPL